VPEERIVAAATGSHGDLPWYMNSGATDHITSDLEKMAVCDKYVGNDQIHTAGGAGMSISHIDHNTIHTPSRQLQLNNILRVPQASKNLISVNRLASDNNVFLEFHPHFFCIKDLDSRNVLLKGMCKEGLYPISSSSLKKFAFGVDKLACGVIKPSFDRWHSRLGHPSIPIVRRIIQDFNLPCLAFEINDSVCGACQQAKRHRLPYPTSTSVSKFPLELVFFMCGG
jgi:hypothetical protein